VGNDDCDGWTKPVDQVGEVREAGLLPYDLHDGACLPIRGRLLRRREEMQDKRSAKRRDKERCPKDHSPECP
jgi:hypothetical protein